MSSHPSPRTELHLADSHLDSPSRSTATRKRSNTKHDVRSPPPRKHSLENLRTTKYSSSHKPPQRSHTTDSTLLHTTQQSSRRKGSSPDPPPIPSASSSHSAQPVFPIGPPVTPNRSTGKYGIMPTTLSPISSSPSFTSSSSPSSAHGISSSVPSTFSLLTTATESFSTEHSFSMSTPRQKNSGSLHEPSPLATTYHAHTQLKSSHTHSLSHTSSNFRMFPSSSRAGSSIGVATSSPFSSAKQIK